MGLCVILWVGITIGLVYELTRYYVSLWVDLIIGLVYRLAYLL